MRQADSVRYRENKMNEWQCTRCGMMNYRSWTRCHLCGAEKGFILTAAQIRAMIQRRLDALEKEITYWSQLLANAQEEKE